MIMYGSIYYCFIHPSLTNLLNGMIKVKNVFQIQSKPVKSELKLDVNMFIRCDHLSSEDLHWTPQFMWIIFMNCNNNLIIFILRNIIFWALILFLDKCIYYIYKIYIFFNLPLLYFILLVIFILNTLKSCRLSSIRDCVVHCITCTNLFIIVHVPFQIKKEFYQLLN